jgi:ammonia channel protein AmtB
MLNASSVFQMKYKQGLGNNYFSSHIESPQHAVMVSIMSSSVSAFVTYVFFNRFRKEDSSQNLSLTVMNSSLAGLVMITGVCDDVNIYSALFIGILAGLLYLTSTQLLERYRIDDPVESVQIHGICGFFGVLNVGIFGNKHGILTNAQNSFR